MTFFRVLCATVDAVSPPPRVFLPPSILQNPFRSLGRPPRLQSAKHVAPIVVLQSWLKALLFSQSLGLWPYESRRTQLGSVWKVTRKLIRMAVLSYEKAETLLYWASNTYSDLIFWKKKKKKNFMKCFLLMLLWMYSEWLFIEAKLWGEISRGGGCRTRRVEIKNAQSQKTL